MLFNSFPFLILISVTFILYYLPWISGSTRSQVGVLIVSSLIFYAWESPILLLLLTASIGINSWISWRIAVSPGGKLWRAFMAGLIFNVLLLAFFKYGSLLARTVLKPETGIATLLLEIPLPIGISFYTFESISLLMDLKRLRERNEPVFISDRFGEHLGQTTLFIAFFPHLISGPILKADQFYRQIGGRKLKDIQWHEAFRLVVIGFFLKCVVADNLKDTTAALSFPSFLGFPPIVLVSLLFGFSVQIFADFAGYSYIAVGVALLFGYQLPRNFDYPYIAASLAEFWRRWHISLSTWLREYLYYPLGGNRLGKVRTYINLFLVMVLGGLWHGAAWSYAAWGFYHGCGLAAERWLLDQRPHLFERLPSFLRVAGVFAYVTIGWIFFKLTRFSDVIEFGRCLLFNWRISIEGNTPRLMNIAAFSLPVLVYYVAGCWQPVRSWSRRNAPILEGALLAAVVISSGLPGSFLYFQF
jgi:alginate O-acetyltransferase complex protein AlgI